MLRSLEKRLEPATFQMTLPAQSSVRTTGPPARPDGHSPPAGVGPAAVSGLPVPFSGRRRPSNLTPGAAARQTGPTAGSARGLTTSG